MDLVSCIIDMSLIHVQHHLIEQERNPPFLHVTLHKQATGRALGLVVNVCKAYSEARSSILL